MVTASGGRRIGTCRAICHGVRTESWPGERVDNMLRITINETPEAATIILEGRLAGEWVAELKRAWTDAAEQLNARRVALDLRNVTYVDEGGKRILREIEEQTGAELIATTPWTKHLVGEI